METPRTRALSAAAGFSMGAGHAVCEDYALASRAQAAIPFVVVADGCSGSPGSDVGARILAHACRSALEDSARDPSVAPAFMAVRQSAATRLLAWRRWLAHQIVLRAQAAAKALSLADEWMDATLLCAFVNERRLFVLTFGDGALRLVFNDRVEFIELKHVSGAPFYLSYNLDEDRRRRYVETCGDAPLLIVRTTQNPDGTVRATRIAPRSALRGLAFSSPIERLRSVTLFSDGLQSFQSTRSGREVPPQPLAIARDLAEPRNLAGEFVVRRMQRFRRDMQRSHWMHRDDLAVATLAVQP